MNREHHSTMYLELLKNEKGAVPKFAQVTKEW